MQAQETRKAEIGPGTPRAFSAPQHGKPTAVRREPQPEVRVLRGSPRELAKGPDGAGHVAYAFGQIRRRAPQRDHLGIYRKRPASLDVFLEYLGITEEEFMKIALSHVVAPHKHDPSKVKRGEPLPDMGKWDRTK